jgi:zinc transport system substrate-binding protein
MKNFIILLALIFSIKNALATENSGAVAQKKYPTPLIVTTIKPIFSLAKSIAGNSIEVELLIKNNASEHDFQLKPSHIKMLKKADMIFYIDDNFEVFLQNSFKNSAPNIKKYQLSKIITTQLKTRLGESWEGSSYLDNHDIYNLQDMHIWLDINNAKKITQYIAEKLISAFPENKKIYSENLKLTLKKLDDLNRDLKTALKNVKNKSFIVSHDAFQYFEHGYGLEAKGSALFDPNESPSIVKIKKIRQKIKNGEIYCVIYDPHFSNKLLKTIIEDSKIRSELADPLGANLINDKDLYFKLMNNLANSFKNCLS